jgi:hypothetical protein
MNKRYYVGGRLNFSATTLTKDQLQSRYDSHFGPCFYSLTGNPVILDKSDENMSLALATRLMGYRIPKGCDAWTSGQAEDFHNDINAQQARNLIPVLEPFLKYVRTFDITYDTTENEVEAIIDEPHPKKKLRQQTWGEIKNQNTTDRLWNHLKHKSVTANVKHELAKHGKHVRLVFNMHVPASLQGAVVTSKFKCAIASEPFRYRGGLIEFIKSPEPRILKKVFERLINPPGRYYFVYFSDDSCLSFRDAKGVPQIYNMDISKCDASHGPKLFEAFTLMGHPGTVREILNQLVDQCRQRFRVYSADKLEKCDFQAEDPILFSGSTITTLINDLANVAICMSIVNDNFEDIKGSAYKVGYMVTMELCRTMYDIQFLKHSPVYDTKGVLRALFNLGAWLRTLGSCHGDLLGKGDISKRAFDFNCALTRGMYPRVNCELFDCFRVDGPLIHDKLMDHTMTYKTSTDETYTVTLGELSQRYGPNCDWSELASVLHSQRHFGLHYCCDAVNLALNKDYSFELDVITYKK